MEGGSRTWGRARSWLPAAHPPICGSRGIGARGPYLARNRDAANLEVHATVLLRGHCGFLAQFGASKTWLRGSVRDRKSAKEVREDSVGGAAAARKNLGHEPRGQQTSARCN
jgi:hypothetical protein